MDRWEQLEAFYTYACAPMKLVDEGQARWYSRTENPMAFFPGVEEVLLAADHSAVYTVSPGTYRFFNGSGRSWISASRADAGG